MQIRVILGYKQSHELHGFHGITAPYMTSLEEPGAGKKSILLVEDDEFSRDLARLLLEKAGYEVTTARDGVDALLALEKTRYDLILSDLQMPNLNGFKLLEVTRLKGIDTPVVFLTAQSGEETEVKALELGAADFIHKPFKKEILLVRVESALKGLPRGTPPSKFPVI